MFATHYHELTTLSTTLTQLVNVHVATLEKDGDVTFLHKIAEGPADKSYGIHVAKIAGLPKSLLQRADSILTRLESGSAKLQLLPEVDSSVVEETPVNNEEPKVEQLNFFADDTANQEVIEALRKVDLMNLTPMQAMNVIYELKNML